MPSTNQDKQEEVVQRKVKPKKKYLTKQKGFDEESDFLYYNTPNDEHEAYSSTNFGFTCCHQKLSSDEY
jgi:hypothetical protein